MVTRSGTSVGVVEDQALPKHYRTCQEKGWQVVNLAFLALPVNEWYLLPSSPTAAQEPRSASKVFGNFVSTSEFLSLMVACGFFFVKSSYLQYNKAALERMQEKYKNLNLSIELYRPGGGKREYYICRGSKKGTKPKLEKDYFDRQGFEAISHLKSINKALVDDVIKDITLPSFSNVNAIDINTNFSTTTSLMTSEANVITPDAGDASAASSWQAWPDDSDIFQVSTVVLDDDTDDDDTDDEDNDDNDKTEDGTAVDNNDNNDVRRASDVNVNGAYKENLGEKGIQAALELDFQKRDSNQKRPARLEGGDAIEISKSKMLTQMMRIQIVMMADAWGWELEKDATKKKHIVLAACCVVCYDHGYATPCKGSKFVEWHLQLHDTVQATMKTTGSCHSFKSCGETKRMGPKQGTYTGRVELAHPGFLHKMYRAAIKQEGPEAPFGDIAKAMNSCSKDHHAEDDSTTPVLKMNRMHVRRWFKANHGKARKRSYRPILTPERKIERKKWAAYWLDKIQDARATGQPLYIAFLDEKWFYIYSRRKKAKILPPGPGEMEEDAFLPTIRVASRRHAEKVMLLGVIAKPETAHNFTGKIELLRVCRLEPCQRAIYNRHFDVGVKKNETVKSSWREALVGTGGTTVLEMKAKDIVRAIAETYELHPEIAQHLVLRYRTFGTKNESIKTVPAETRLGRLKIRHVVGERPVPLTLQHTELYVQRKKGELVEKDVTCDSQFMLDNMEHIGATIRSKFHWVPKEMTIYLIMDNAGGHGTKDAIAQYVADIKQDHNVEIVWQVPRGPEMNLLDLGSWTSLQSWVEKSHRGRRTNVDALAFTCFQAWETFGSEVFDKVYERWERVLKIVVADNGDNSRVDDFRGDLFTSVIEPLYQAERAAMLLADAAALEEENAQNDEEDDDDASSIESVDSYPFDDYDLDG
jgi:hypothetical protein